MAAREDKVTVQVDAEMVERARAELGLGGGSDAAVVERALNAYLLGRLLDVTNLLFALVARRYERGSIIVTSNRCFEAWGEILGDQMVAATLIDRLVHHAHIITPKGKGYRLKERGTEGAPAIPSPVAHYSLPQSGALFGSC